MVLKSLEVREHSCQPSCTATQDNGAAMIAWVLGFTEPEVKATCEELGFVLVEDILLLW